MTRTIRPTLIRLMLSTVTVLPFISRDTSAQTESEIRAKFTYEAQTWQGVYLQYRLFSPESPEEGVLYPIVIALHGGWGGTDNEPFGYRVATAWADTVNQNRHPAFVVAPRAPPNTTLYQAPVQQAVMNLLDSLEARLPIDPDRIYVTGYSNGGTATFNLLNSWPNRFAAAVPMSGWGPSWSGLAWLHVPVWAFHGRLDDVIPVEGSRRVFRSLDGAGMHTVYTHCRPEGGCDEIDDCVLDSYLPYRRHLYTEFPDLYHVIWTQVYNDRRMVDWTFRQRRGKQGNGQSVFETAVGVDMTHELGAPRHVGVTGDILPVSGSDPVRLCDPDGDKVYVGRIAFDESSRGSTLSYRFSHSAFDGTDVVTESAAPARSSVLQDGVLPVVFWNDQNAQPPSTPAYLEPPSGSTVGYTVQLAWRSGTVGGWFDVQVAEDPEFASIILDRESLDEHRIIVTDLYEGRPYFWRVRATNVLGAGDWAESTFRTLGTAVTLIEPPDQSIVESSVLLRWDPYPEAGLYYVQLSQDPSFSDVSWVRLVTTEYLAESLSPGARYYWRIKANLAPDISETWSFQVADPTGVAAIDELPLTTRLLGNYPNPFNPSTTVSFALAEQGEVRLSVADVLGREVRVIYEGVRAAGTYEVPFDASGLPSGIYLCRMKTEHIVEARSMVLLR